MVPSKFVLLLGLIVWVSYVQSDTFNYGGGSVILRGTNFGYANFVRYPNSKLRQVQGAVTTFYPNHKECAKGCTMNSTCLSFNYGTEPVFWIGGEDFFTCELIPTDKYNRTTKLISKNNFHHYSLQVRLHLLHFKKT